MVLLHTQRLAPEAVLFYLQLHNNKTLTHGTQQCRVRHSNCQWRPQFSIDISPLRRRAFSCNSIVCSLTNHTTLTMLLRRVDSHCGANPGCRCAHHTITSDRVRLRRTVYNRQENDSGSLWVTWCPTIVCCNAPQGILKVILGTKWYCGAKEGNKFWNNSVLQSCQVGIGRAMRGMQYATLEISSNERDLQEQCHALIHWGKWQVSSSCRHQTICPPNDHVATTSQ